MAVSEPWQTVAALLKLTPETTFARLHDVKGDIAWLECP
jgi:hypothetical protein